MTRALAPTHRVPAQPLVWRRPSSQLLDLLRRLPLRRPRWMRGPRLERVVTAPRIETPRLKLRPHRSADASAWYVLQSDPNVLRYLPWPPRSRRASRRHLRHRTRHIRLEQAGDFLALAVELDGRLIGDVSLHLREVDPRGRRAEIGWLIGTEWAGRGFATEAARAMLKFAFDTLEARYVTAVMDPDNERSHVLARRLGFLDIADAGGERTLLLSREQFRRCSQRRDSV
ncbi:GNAT family N-acetyltransferase [Agromyces albus]|uniref:GNAT family N-acetyltransferase n=1 Tax=Agromyces albus TaxID=205332 RepID=UPI0027847A81|nr:GNAT family N-acetyltransferase [Agromyces albus]MDQ0574384.1 RimJ/RimL family protein N-acetyltransferase [Agromyces albus]